MELQDNALTSKRRGLADSRWWRWTRYELREGCIGPAPGAKLRTYDPWKLWLKTRPIGRRSDSGAKWPTPYRALLELLRKLKYRDDSEDLPPVQLHTDQLFARLTAESEQAVLDWCAHYGLLGVLPHRVLQVVLAPGRLGEQVQYVRIGTGWLAVSRHRPNPDAPMPQPSALVQPLFGSVVSVEPLSKTWARFFPRVPPAEQETFSYPEPLTPQFWAAYGEPLEEFISGARALQDLLEGIHLFNRRKLRAFHEAASGGLPVAAHSLVAPMGLAVRVKRDRHVELIFVGNSLLTSLAVMLLQDLSRGRALQCECGQVFVSSAYQARYCSTRCRWRFEQKRFRSKP